MPRERKRRERYVPSQSKPDPGWLPPSHPETMFDCVATRCRLSADACCLRQIRTIQGTPEPRFPFCHPSCHQGAMVRAAMPCTYTPRKGWRIHSGISARPRDPESAPLDVGPYAEFRELNSLVAKPVPTRDDEAPMGTPLRFDASRALVESKGRVSRSGLIPGAWSESP